MGKKKHRTVHINNEEWGYVVDNYKNYDDAQVRIYSPTKKMVRVSTYDICIESETMKIQPSSVKTYIEKHLL